MKTDSEDVEKTPEKRQVSFEEAFDLTESGWCNRLALAGCGLALLHATLESLGAGYVLPAAACDLQLDTKQKGYVSAAAFLGIMSTSLVWGLLGDRLGRRAVTVPALLLAAACSLASSAASSVWVLVPLRFLTGCFVSGSSATVYAYLSEMSPRARRAAALAHASSAISIAFILLPGMAWLILPLRSVVLWGREVAAWRVLMWVWGLTGAAAGALLALLPESPRLLLARGGPRAALPALQTIYAWNTGNKREDYPVSEIVAPAEAGGGGVAGALRSAGLLFRPPLLRCVLISHVSMFAVFLLSSGLYVWVPDILNSVLQDGGGGGSICQIIHNKFVATNNATLAGEAVCVSEVATGVFPVSMAMGAVFGVTYLAIGFLIDRVGRVTLYFVIMVVCGVATGGAGAAAARGGAALLVLALCSGCAASILAAIAVDVFPTSMRAMAVCILYTMGRAGAALGSQALALTLDAHCQPAFTTIAVFVAGSALLILLWPKPEEVRKEMEKKGFSY
ncbi:hypothetical protein JYU34_004816 [Plutella xylostella]|uniref:Major facilitator superfamily (MFS) profile domain-containing protein n=1 Tax=Plutella xylostella TaxID=51655 RepID=A0ABQ7QZ06_PLUXY|nr:hypothetical protein JYU34_004816 [Plutella xylostella]